MKKTIIIMGMIIGTIISMQTNAQMPLKPREVKLQEMRLSGDFYNQLYDYLLYFAQNVDKNVDSTISNDVYQQTIYDYAREEDIRREMYEINQQVITAWYGTPEERAEKIKQARIEEVKNIFLFIVFVIVALIFCAIVLFLISIIIYFIYLCFKSLVDHLVDQRMKEYGFEKPKDE